MHCLYPYAEDEKWRKPFCWVQAPLAWASLTMWAWISPTYFSCLVSDSSNAPTDLSAHKTRILNTLKKAVKAAGGDTLVVTKLGKTEYITSANVSLGSLEMTSAQGFAVKRSDSPRK
jgi:hypothetical protein